MKYEFTWRTTMAEIDRSAWDQLAGNNALTTWGWLRTIEETCGPDWQLRYLTMNRDGALAGAAICQVVESARDDRMDALVFGRARPIAWRCGVSLAPALVCGPCGTYGSHLITGQNLATAEREQLESLLIDALQAHARELSMPLAFVHVLQTQPSLIGALRARGFGSTLLSPMAQLDVDWSSYAGYEEHIRSVSRKALRTVRNERSRNRREGVTIEVIENPEAHCERLIELLSLTSQKYSGVPFWYRDNYFDRLKLHLADRAIVYGAWKKEQLIGTSVMVTSATDGYLLEIGVDHEQAGNDFSYFNLGYYRPIEDAIELGLSRLHFDNAFHELKARRGCRLISDYLFYHENKPLRRIAVNSWFALHTRQFRHKHAHLDKYSYS